MTSRRMEFLIGMMVLTIFVTIGIMTVLFGSRHSQILHFRHGEGMTILFDKASGIKNTSRVTKSGIEIGRVYRTELLDSEEGIQVKVYFSIDDPNVKIFSNERAQINKNFLNEAEIEFVKNQNYEGEIRELTPNDIIVGTSGNDIMGTVSNIEGDLTNAIQSVNLAAQEAARFIGGMNQFIGSESEIKMKQQRLEAIFTELNETLKSTRSLATNMNEIISDPTLRESIRLSVTNVPNILTKVDGLLGNADLLSESIRKTIDKSHTTLDQIGDNLDNLSDFTSSLSTDGTEFVSNLNASSKDINAMVNHISELADNLVKEMSDPDTPLGLLGDREMGDSIRQTVQNIEGATEKVHPILDDARVFTNKIAHRPSSLIFGKTTYKGGSALSSNNNYQFQSYSPYGGMNSGLFTPSAAYYNSANGYGASAGYYGGYDPDSYEGYYYSHPEMAYGANQSRQRACFSEKLSKLKPCFCFHKQEADENDQPGYTTDMAEYYGMESPAYLPASDYADGDYGIPNAADLAPGEYLADVESQGTPCRTKCLAEKSCASRFGFSLGSPFKKLFHHGEDCGEKKGCLKTCMANKNLPMDVVYEPSDWEGASIPYSGSMINASALSSDCQPGCEPNCEPNCQPLCETGCGQGNAPSVLNYGPQTSASGNDLKGLSTLPNSSAASADPSLLGNLDLSIDNGVNSNSPAENPSLNPPAEGEAEVLPQDIVRPQSQDGYQKSPVNSEYQSEMGGYPSQAIPMAPIPQSAGGFQPIQAPKGTSMRSEQPSVLPSPIDPAAQPKKTAMNPGAVRTVTVAKPVAARQFVDDGLPVQFTPNH